MVPVVLLAADQGQVLRLQPAGDLATLYTAAPATKAADRALVAEQAARIAALEAGELVRIVRQFRDFARSGAGFSYPPGSLQAIDAALAKLGGPDGKTE